MPEDYCARHYDNFERVYGEIKDLKDQSNEFIIITTKIQAQVTENKKSVDHVTKVVHGAIGLILTVVLSALLYVIVRSPPV